MTVNPRLQPDHMDRDSPFQLTPEAQMHLTELISQLEDLLDQNGDMMVQLDSGQPVQEVDFVYPMDPDMKSPAVPAEAIVIK